VPCRAHTATQWATWRHLAPVFVRVAAPEVPVGGLEEDELEDEFAEIRPAAIPPKGHKMPILSGFWRGGAEGGRTPDLLIAKNEFFTGPCNSRAICTGIFRAMSYNTDFIDSFVARPKRFELLPPRFVV
jgi:hypothetical protein